MDAKVKEALDLAKGILDYCPGDRWERECTQEDRERFNQLYEELCPEEKPQEPVQCLICHKSFPDQVAYEAHARTNTRHRITVEKIAAQKEQARLAHLIKKERQHAQSTPQ
jgi:hypothetical protein